MRSRSISTAIGDIRQLRYLLIAQFNQGVDTIWLGRQLYAGEVAEIGEQTLSDAEGALTWRTTVNAMVDKTMVCGSGTTSVGRAGTCPGGRGLHARWSDGHDWQSACGDGGTAYSQDAGCCRRHGPKTWFGGQGDAAAGLTLSSLGHHRYPDCGWHVELHGEVDDSVSGSALKRCPSS
ncbi:hypothetical protein GS887_27675 [Rhodococcus hoagii]|nr:hypothetical protein [Prescottella equi]